MKRISNAEYNLLVDALLSKRLKVPYAVICKQSGAGETSLYKFINKSAGIGTVAKIQKYLNKDKSISRKGLMSRIGKKKGTYCRKYNSNWSNAVFAKEIGISERTMERFMNKERVSPGTIALIEQYLNK